MGMKKLFRRGGDNSRSDLEDVHAGMRPWWAWGPLGLVWFAGHSPDSGANTNVGHTPHHGDTGSYHHPVDHGGGFGGGGFDGGGGGAI